ncbi:S-adenosyl-L-methionine-dependent methyltransferase [Entophlyctis helioformis]|nr:S-adenosyl-L-methionine-dependent methyltransferase [Entophlyctis helioformis]
MEPANAKTTSSLAEFGTRKLENEEDVFDHNAWDNVEWDEVQEEEARRQVQAQLDSKTLDDDQIETFDKKAAGFWDDFYSKNVNRFFKDRHWLRLEFPELFERLPRDSEETFTLCEMGCGAGNTVFPFLQEAGEAKVFVYACDYSKEAVGVVKGSELYDESRCKGIVYDITAPDIPPEIAPGSVDVCTCIFVLSAIHPSTWAQAVRNLYKMLKPGGLVLLRDYGRYDLAQLRFKPARVLEENFYVRGDGTRVYFFTNEELATMFSGFEVVQNGIDRRLLVNRTRKLKMYRSWVQAKLRKPLDAPPLSE